MSVYIYVLQSSTSVGEFRLCAARAKEGARERERESERERKREGKRERASLQALHKPFV